MATVSKFTRGAVTGNAWTNPANLTADDGVYATAAPAKNGTTSGDWDFDAFSDVDIPVGSTINSTVLETQFKVSTTSSIATLQMFAVVGGGNQGSVSDATEPTADKIVTLTTTTPITEANLKTAGQVVARISAQRGNSTTGVTFSVDYAKLTVTYTAPAPALTATVATTQATQSESLTADLAYKASGLTAQAAQSEAVTANLRSVASAATTQAVQSESVTASVPVTGLSASVAGAQAKQAESLTAKLRAIGAAAGSQAVSTNVATANLRYVADAVPTQKKQTNAIAVGLRYIASSAASQLAQMTSVMVSIPGGTVMAQAKSASPATLTNRRLAADAILHGYDDGDLATILSNARTAGFPAQGSSEQIADTQVGGIIAGVNR